MNVMIYAPPSGVPDHIIRYIEEIIRLAKLHENGLNKASVFFKDTGEENEKRYACEIEFTISDRSFLLRKEACSYFEAVYAISQEFKDKIRAA